MLSAPTRTLPETGTFTIAAWAEELNLNEATVREYVQRYRIPTDGLTIDARVWWRTIANSDRQSPVVTDPPAKRNRRRRGKGGIKPVPNGTNLKDMKSRIPNGKLITVFLAGLSPAGKGYALAYLLEQARNAQQAKAAQQKPERGEPC